MVKLLAERQSVMLPTEIGVLIKLCKEAKAAAKQVIAFR